MKVSSDSESDGLDTVLVPGQSFLCLGTLNSTLIELSGLKCLKNPVRSVGFDSVRGNNLLSESGMERTSVTSLKFTRGISFEDGKSSSPVPVW